MPRFIPLPRFPPLIGIGDHGPCVCREGPGGIEALIDSSHAAAKSGIHIEHFSGRSDHGRIWSSGVILRVVEPAVGCRDFWRRTGEIREIEFLGYTCISHDC